MEIGIISKSKSFAEPETMKFKRIILIKIVPSFIPVILQFRNSIPYLIIGLDMLVQFFKFHYFQIQVVLAVCQWKYVKYEMCGIVRLK
jgi:hypothetical protein